MIVTRENQSLLLMSSYRVPKSPETTQRISGTSVPNEYLLQSGNVICIAVSDPRDVREEKTTRELGAVDG